MLTTYVHAIAFGVSVALLHLLALDAGAVTVAVAMCNQMLCMW
jgi:hypothetical protein